MYKEINDYLIKNSYCSTKTFRSLDGIYEHMEDVNEHGGKTLDIWS